MSVKLMSTAGRGPQQKVLQIKRVLEPVRFGSAFSDSALIQLFNGRDRLSGLCLNVEDFLMMSLRLSQTVSHCEPLALLCLYRPKGSPARVSPRTQL